MDNTKFTKGKWEVIEHSWSDTSLVSGDYTIATKSIYYEVTEENENELETELQYNFLLISKAPEMLVMLKECMRVLSSVQSPATPSIFLHRKIEQLIKEATTL